MRVRTTSTWRRTAASWIFCLSILSVMAWGTTTWASTRIGNMELQLWYRTRNTFQTDGGQHFDWVQWRNEVFGWLIYEDLVKNGRVLNKIELPLVQNATLNARYRFRADPVYEIRDHFKHIYDGDERGSFIIPENGFRDLFLDMDFGNVGPGSLSMRVGNQQIVWGESDLFRSLDIINPLRIDQNTITGEKFDEFRTPIFALKALYTIGNVGESLSNVAIESWYSPRYRSGTSNTILEGNLRLPSHLKGCLDANGELIPFDQKRCSEAVGPGGQRVFVPYRPPWLNDRRTRNPWHIFSFTANNRHTPDPVNCLTRFCSPDVVGQQAALWPIIRDGRDQSTLKGWGSKAQGGGFRILGNTWFGMDFTLNYMFLPSGPTGVFDLNRFLVDPGPGKSGPVQIKPDLFYGDPAVAQALGFPPSLVAGHSFADGLRRCVTNGGKSGGFESKDRGSRAPTVLVGADLWGFNNPARFGPNGALQPDGAPKPGKHHSVRPPLTFCLPANQDFLWKHVVGFTGTYNDFDYTGAVFRLEQSWSSKEVIRNLPGGFGARFGQPISHKSLHEAMHRFTPVWRSMLGFDLLRSLAFFRYLPGIHHSFYEQQWFISGQWLMENNWSNIANNICQDNDSTGGFTEEEAAAFQAANPGQRVYPFRHCRRYRWNHLLTLSMANQGLFGSRLETRNAVAFEPRGQQYLLYSQWWWRNVLGYPNVELSGGVAWFPGSYMADSWSSLNYYAPRDQVWLEFTYYLL